MTSSPLALAHGGHGDEFQAGDTASENPASIQVEAKTAQRLGLKVEPVTRKRLDVGIKTTGQIETLPSKKVEVTAPIPGKITELLVEPGALVHAGQALAVVASAELIELRVAAAERRAGALAELKLARADVNLAQENVKRQHKIAAAILAQAQTEVNVATEQYERDQELSSQGALPRRTMLESQAHLAEGKAKLAQATNQQDVIKAENELKRAQAELEVANSRLQLSNTTYQTRLEQLGTIANAKGLVVVKAPIAGKVADREVTLGQSFQDAGGKLMTIVNDSRVFATANIHEKDLEQIKLGQKVRVKVGSLPQQTYLGTVARIGSVVERETRVVPVQAELDNASGQMKPGQFAELEIITEQTPTAILVIPNSAVVEANNKNLVYLQNGNAFEAVEVTLGRTSGDLVEVKTGLFEGDLIVTQRAPLLYAQSLRGGDKPGIPSAEPEGEVEPVTAPNKTSSGVFAWAGLESPKWILGWVGVGAICLGVGAFITGAFWSSRRTRHQQAETAISDPEAIAYPTEVYARDSNSLSSSQSTQRIEKSGE